MGKEEVKEIKKKMLEEFVSRQIDQIENGDENKEEISCILIKFIGSEEEKKQLHITAENVSNYDIVKASLSLAVGLIKTEISSGSKTLTECCDEFKEVFDTEVDEVFRSKSGYSTVEVEEIL